MLAVIWVNGGVHVSDEYPKGVPFLFQIQKGTRDIDIWDVQEQGD